jgi:hypothetical protein
MILIFDKLQSATKIFNYLIKVGFLSFFCLLLTACSDILTTVELFECKDSKGTLNDYKLKIHRSFFAKSNLMKIPSKVEALDIKRNICSENQSIIYAGEDCKGDKYQKQSLIYNKKNGKLEIYISPSIVRRATCTISL